MSAVRQRSVCQNVDPHLPVPSRKSGRPELVASRERISDAEQSTGDWPRGGSVPAVIDAADVPVSWLPRDAPADMWAAICLRAKRLPINQSTGDPQAAE